MMKRILLVLIGLSGLLLLHAQSVSKEAATKVAIKYMENRISDDVPENHYVLSTSKGIDTTYTRSLSITGLAPLFLVQLPDGWILVASEYIETPVLASARNGQFPNPDEMPDGMKWLISYYEEGMQYVRDSLMERPDVRKLWDTIYENTESNNRDTGLPDSYEIPGIRSIKWNQSRNNDSSCTKPYNAKCPTWYTPACGHTYVGCIAVAMGIVMRYYQWPYSAQIPDAIDSTGNMSGNKHLVTYNWEKMPYEIHYSTDEESFNEITGLLRDCGYACKMKYGNNGSGAYLEDARTALQNNFHYANAACASRSWFLGNMINFLKSEIAANRPVIYSGYNDNRGHAFVLCGYTASNKFNINWGWGGAYNSGEFSLDSLKPYPSHAGFDQDQMVLWGMVPDYPACSSYVVRQSDVNQTNFEIYHGGLITLQNITLNNNINGVIYSEEEVKLTSGMHIVSGAKVHVSIRDMHCSREYATNDETNTQEDIIFKSPQQLLDIDSYSPSAATKFLRNGQIYIQRGDKTYTIQGQIVR